MKLVILALILTVFLFSIQVHAAQDEAIKDDVDQALHFGIGMVATYGLTFVVGTVAAPLTVMTFAFGRELHQHDWSVKEMGPGSWRDLGYWGLGAAVGVTIK